MAKPDDDMHQEALITRQGFKFDHSLSYDDLVARFASQDCKLRTLFDEARQNEG
jgi:hypothetical protein